MSETAASHVEAVEWRRKKTPWSLRPQSRAQTEFRGVYRLASGAYGASIWDPSSRTQVWLGTFGIVEDAARAYAFAKAYGAAAAVKLPGAGRRRSRSSKFRGVRQRSNGRYSASIKESKGQALTALGTFGTAEEAARAYDAAAVKLHGGRAVTNFSQDSVLIPAGTQHHDLSMAEWQQVDELLKDMDSADDRDALIEAAAVLHQIALAGHGDGGGAEMMNIADP